MSATFPRITLDVDTEVYEFSDEQVSSAQIVAESNPVSVELPASSLEFQVINTQFTMFSPAVKALKRHIVIDVWESVDVAEQYMGRFYLDDWDNISAYEFKFIAVDIIGVLESIPFDGIFWQSAVSLQSALSQTLGQIGISYTLDPSIQNTEIKGWIPPGNYRQALQYICFAAGATVLTSRRNNISITALDLPDLTPTVTVDDAGQLDSRSAKLLPLVTKVELVSHNYELGTEQEQIYEETLQPGTHKVVFTKPYYNIVINGPGFQVETLAFEDGMDFVFEDGELLEVAGEYIQGVNSVTFVLDEAGTVTITGTLWVDNKRSFIFEEDGVAESDKQKNLLIEDSTLINPDNAQTILDNLRDYYRLRYQQNMTILPSEIKPRDIMRSNALYSTLLLTQAHRVEFDLTGGFLAKAVSRGLRLLRVRRPVSGLASSGGNLTWQHRFREILERE